MEPGSFFLVLRFIRSYSNLQPLPLMSCCIGLVLFTLANCMLSLIFSFLQLLNTMKLLSAGLFLWRGGYKSTLMDQWLKIERLLVVVYCVILKVNFLLGFQPTKGCVRFQQWKFGVLIMASSWLRIMAIVRLCWSWIHLVLLVSFTLTLTITILMLQSLVMLNTCLRENGLWRSSIHAVRPTKLQIIQLCWVMLLNLEFVSMSIRLPIQLHFLGMMLWCFFFQDDCLVFSFVFWALAPFTYQKREELSVRLSVHIKQYVVVLPVI